MKSWREEDLILHFYGEHPRREEIERCLAEDPDLRRRLDALRPVSYTHLTLPTSDLV